MKHLCLGLFLIMLQALLKETPSRCFSVNITKFLRTSILKNFFEATSEPTLRDLGRSPLICIKTSKATE